MNATHPATPNDLGFLDDLALRLRRRLPLILQTESTECGLACLAMILGSHGYRTDLASLRARFPISLKGTTLEHLMQIAEDLGLSSRALKLDLSELHRLQTPCILHWNFKHFVVLRRVAGDSIIVHDPACGRRRLPLSDVSSQFTGVALELWRKADFRPKRESRGVKLRQLLGHVGGLYRSLGQVLLLSLGMEVFAVVSPLFLQWVVDNVIVSADTDLLTTLVVGFALLLIIQCVVTSARSWVTMFVATMLSVQGRANVFSHLLRLPVQYFEKRHLGDLVSRFGSVEQIQRLLTTGFLEAIMDGLMVVVTLTVMFVYAPTLAWIAVAAVCLYGIARWLWYRALFEATGSQIVLAARQQTHFLESMRGIRTLKLFQREQTRRSSWLSIFVDQTNAGVYIQRLQIAYDFVHNLLVGAQHLLIIWLGAKLVLEGQFTIGVLMAFSQYNNHFNGRVTALIDKLFQFRLMRVYGEWLGDIVLAAPEPRAPSTGDAPAETDSVEPSIRIERVSFRYGDNEPPVLHDIDMEIRSGESVALTGPSGGGKSTLIGVIMGIRPPTTGDVLIGGISLRRIGPDALRAMVATVMQDDVLFAGSLAENICFFDPKPDREWMKECARMAAIHDDIMAMPMGYNSLVGDMGTVLSGGQKQRVLLARALYKRPKILILDEATSHLDVECERTVSRTLQAQKFTRLVVAHRPETIAAMDRCITLANGRIISQENLGASRPAGNFPHAVSGAHAPPAAPAASLGTMPAYLDPELLTARV